MTTITLRLAFPAGRYHATPWDAHVNEGRIEWPPSPWRILRALLSVGHTSGMWPEGVPSPAARDLIGALATAPPDYRLPPAIGAHSRHYLPTAAMKSGKENTTLVFDTWARIEQGEIAVVWNDLSLAPAALEELHQLSARLGYLGRSESWVQARLLVDDAAETSPNCYPDSATGHPGPGWEPVSLLAALPELDYGQWRESRIASALAALPLPENGKKPTSRRVKERQRALAPYPQTLLDCLQADTDWLRSQGWNQPPGSRRLTYWRRVDALEGRQGRGRVTGRIQPAAAVRRPWGYCTPADPASPTAMLLALSHASGNKNVLPRVEYTLPLAERFHRALVRSASRTGAAILPVITGQDQNRQPLKGPHLHTHILPLDLDADGRLDHLLLWALMGFDSEAQAALRAVRNLYIKAVDGPLRLSMVGQGNTQTLAGLRAPFGPEFVRQTGASIPVSHWISATPFVAPRFTKPTGKNSLYQQVAAELAARELPPPKAVDVIPLVARSDGGQPATGTESTVQLLRIRHFTLARSESPAPPVRFGHALRITLDPPLCGPLSLGYASHFGLGRFRPDPRDEE